MPLISFTPVVHAPTAWCSYLSQLCGLLLITRQAGNAIPSLFWIDNLNCATVLRVLHTMAVGINLESLVVNLCALVS